MPEEAERIVFTGESIYLDLALMIGGYGDATTISGRVLTTEGHEPPDWIDVTACPVTGDPCASAAASPFFFPVGGRFTVVVPGAGEYRLCFVPRPGSNVIGSCWSGPGGDTISLGEGDHITGIAGAVVLGGSVDGKILGMPDPYGGETFGLVGATVRLYRDEAGPTVDPVAEQVVTAADGSYEFRAVPPGFYTVQADPSGASGDARDLVAEFYTDAVTWADRTAFEVESGESTGSIYLALSLPLGRIGGTLSYQDGGVDVPSGAQVELWSVDSGSPELVASDRTYEDAFWFHRVPPGSYVVRVDPWGWDFNAEYWDDAGYLWDAAPIVVENRSVSELEFDLEPRSLEMSRVTGADRFSTSVEIAQQVFGTDDVPAAGIPVVYLANGLNYPDALGAGPAAIHNGGVVLLTYPWSLPETVKAELERLRPQRIVVVGGEPSVSSSVVAVLEGLDFDPSVGRIKGADRFATSRAIARDTYPAGADVAFIATGTNYPDALAAGPPAGMLGAPIILVNGKADTLDQATLTLLEQLGVDEIYVIGGDPSVSYGIFTQLQSDFGATNVTRLTGRDRFETALQIAIRFYDKAEIAYLATGLNFPDALAGGPAAAHFGGPLYLSHPDCLSFGVAYHATTVEVNGLVLLGGTPSLSANVENGVECP